MKPEKETLIEELQHRIKLIGSIDEEPMRSILNYEKSVYSEVIELIKVFERRTFAKEISNTFYTPILDYHTKEPLLIGDKVKDNHGRCGYLHFDTSFNRYLIKSETGGHNPSSVFIKIDELFDYTVDIDRTECRPNPSKRKF